MFDILKKVLLLMFLMLSLICTYQSKNMFVSCEDEVDEEDDDEAIVDDGTGTQVEETASEDEEDNAGMKGSPDVDTVILFTNPSGPGSELPAGKLVEFLVGFTNNGDRDFILDSIDASFRYPMDFSFYIQNFTAIPYHRTVKPRHEATLMYSFYPAEAFAGRPLGLSVNLAYHNADGDGFVEAIFNQTVNIIDVEEGLDGETFFLYLFLLAFSVLLLLAGHHFLSSFGRKKAGTVVSKKPAVETGTNIKDGIDYDWLPKELLNEVRKSPRQSSRNKENNVHVNNIRQSPRNRKSKREGSSH